MMLDSSACLVGASADSSSPQNADARQSSGDKRRGDAQSVVAVDEIGAIKIDCHSPQMKEESRSRKRIRKEGLGRRRQEVVDLTRSDEHEWCWVMDKSGEIFCSDDEYVPTATGATKSQIDRTQRENLQV